MSEHAIPAEVFSILPHDNLEDALYQVLGSSPGNSLGETHLVAVKDALFVFFRNSRLDSLKMAVLKDGEQPRIQNGAFGASLLIPIQGQDAEACVPLNPAEIGVAELCLNHAWPGEAMPLELPLEPVVPQAAPQAPPLAPTGGLLDKAMHRVKGVGGKTRDFAKDPLTKTVDHALDIIEFVASRAAKRQTISSLKVEANINLVVGQVAIEVGYNKEELQKLVETNN